MKLEDFKVLVMPEKLNEIYQKLSYLEKLLTISLSIPEQHTCEQSGVTFPVKNITGN